MITGLYMKSDVEMEMNMRRVTVVTGDIYMKPHIVTTLLEDCRTTKTTHKWHLEFDDGTRMTNDMSIYDRIAMRGAAGVKTLTDKAPLHPTAMYNIVYNAIKTLAPDEQLIAATYDASVWHAVRAAVKYGVIKHTEAIGVFLTPNGAQEVLLDKGGLECTAPKGFFDGWWLQEEELDG
jgi:hypothetical protein